MKCHELAEKLFRRCQLCKIVLLTDGDLTGKSMASQHRRRFIVGVSGIPGAGKSTVTDLVVQHINDLYCSLAVAEGMKSGTPLAVGVPMDGFHFTRAQLKQMPEPEVATHRRGAAFTYDAEAFFDFIKRLRQAHSAELTVMAPSFDHAVKDPVQDDIKIEPGSLIVLIEGNYCALDRAPWSDAAKLMDELWFVDVDREVARERLALRHVKSSVTPDLNSAYDRIQSTDFLNADDIADNMLEVQEVIDMS